MKQQLAGALLTLYTRAQAARVAVTVNRQPYITNVKLLCVQGLDSRHGTQHHTGRSHWIISEQGVQWRTIPPAAELTTEPCAMGVCLGHSC